MAGNTMVLVRSANENDDPALQDSAGIKTLHDAVSMLKQEPHMSGAFRTNTSANSTADSMTESESDDEQQPTALAAAKAHLKAVLIQHDRSAKHPEVAKAVEELSALNPTKDATLSPYIDGNFVSLTRPEFPGRIKQEPGKEPKDQYTLGRMSFNIFQPADLVCTVVRLRNDLIRVPKEEEGETQYGQEGRSYKYPLKTDVIIHTPKGDFPASLLMEANCTSDKQPKNRLGVVFVGGTLLPGEEVRSDPVKLGLWKEVFANAYEKANAERSYLSSFMLQMFKWMFKLTTPTDEQALASASCSVQFEMKRCPHGYFDVLYLDEDMRITRGNRGTVVILERTPQE